MTKATPCFYLTFKVTSGHIMSKGIKGHIRLTMRFSKPLSETINIIIYGSFPEILSIGHSRNVNLGA